MDHLAENWSDDLECTTLSDRGMRRANNQDSYVTMLASNEETWRRRGHVFAVADGMGAHAAGELASKMATDNVAHAYHKLLQLIPPEALRKSLSDTNELIYRRGQSSPDFHGMGTTCSTLVLLPQGALVGHVGDSRVYRLRGQKLDQLTFDHSLVWEIEAASRGAKPSSRLNVPSNVITRSLGPHQEVQVDLEGPHPIQLGDTFLLCSDGLSGKVNDDEIGILLGCLSVEEAARTLVDLANLRGGPDNITVIVVKVTGRRLTSPPGEVAWEAPPPRDSSAGGSVVPALAATIGVLAGLSLALMENWAPAAACFVFALIAGGIVLWRRMGSNSGESAASIRPLGKGPHRTIEVRPSQELVVNLSSLVSQLREASGKNNWPIDQQELQEWEKQASAAFDSGDATKAIVEYTRVIRAIMQSLRENDPNLSNMDMDSVD